MGLANFVRSKALLALAGTSFTAITTYAQLLTALPTTDGTSGGGVLDEVEWSLDRILVNVAGGASPAWIAASGPNGGYSIENEHLIQWDATATAALAEDTTVVGVAIYSASTAGNLLAYEAFDSSRVVPVGGVFNFQAGDLVINMHKDLC